jgi:hypothetical protein
MRITRGNAKPQIGYDGRLYCVRAYDHGLPKELRGECDMFVWFNRPDSVQCLIDPMLTGWPSNRVNFYKTKMRGKGVLAPNDCPCRFKVVE